MRLDDRSAKYDIVVVGTSMGGLRALHTLLAGLTADFPLPVVLLQHRGVESDDRLCPVIQEFCALPVKEAEDKEVILAGRVYVAPTGYHLLFEGDAFALSTDAPVRYARPSIDVMFESAADAYAKRVIGVILTGASDDGAQGVAEIKRRGGLVIVQDPATAESPTMPAAAIAAAKVDHIVPLSGIAPLLVSLCQARRSLNHAKR